MNKINKELLNKLYVEEMKTDVEIAEILGCHKQTVHNTRKKFKIKSYKRWERNICEPTQRQLEVIYGSLLGDGHISNGIKNGKPCQSIFEDKHCDGQKDYVIWKHNELKPISRSLRPVKNGNKTQWRIRTFHHPFFTKLRSDFYPDGIKIVNHDVLKNIGRLGLAVWYMDDGTLCQDSGHTKFCTCSFTEVEHGILSEWLSSKFGINTEMKVYGGYRFLVVISKKKLYDTIRNYLIPSMKYKIGE